MRTTSNKKIDLDSPIYTRRTKIEASSGSSINSDSSSAIISLYNSWSSDFPSATISSCDSSNQECPDSLSTTLLTTGMIEEVMAEEEGYDHVYMDDNDDDTLTLDHRFSFLPLMDPQQQHRINPDDLLDELRKRLPSADLPPRIRKFQRRCQPLCRFLNFMGTRVPPLATVAAAGPTVARSMPIPDGEGIARSSCSSSINPLNELGLHEQDALFPFIVSIQSDFDVDCCGSADQSMLSSP